MFSWKESFAGKTLSAEDLRRQAEAHQTAGIYAQFSPMERAMFAWRGARVSIDVRVWCVGRVERCAMRV